MYAKGGLTWSTLVELQLCLMKSEENSKKFEEQVSHLERAKGDLLQRLNDLQISTELKQPVNSVLRDEIFLLSQDKVEYLGKRNSLIRDLKSAENLLMRLKLDVAHRHKSLQHTEEQCANMKASIKETSGERIKVLEEMTSLRKKIDEQRSTITTLSHEARKQKAFGEKLKRQHAELRETHDELKGFHAKRKQQIASLQRDITETRRKVRNSNVLLKQNLRTLQERSLEAKRLGIRSSY